MSRTIISTQAAPAAPPSYSQAVKAAGLVFVSGTAPIDPSTGELVKGPVQARWPSACETSPLFSPPLAAVWIKRSVGR